MHLWTEYEGRTVAGAYTLGKLLRSEGRNGFFATSDNDGKSAVIRLTEAHFDEEEVLKRWRQVADLHQDHLIEIERVGQTHVDGVALTYALMERNDANLEDVLKERPLTTAETTEVAKSVLAALKVLHESGLVHEHVEPVNILAVGEVVKLRSDCVRECVADGEFTSEEACEELRKRDIHDFGVLLLRCLTLDKEWSTAHKLAEPFRRIVPAAIDGNMSLRQMDSLLNPASATAPAASNASVAGAPQSTATTAAAASSRSSLVPEGVRASAASAAAVERTRESAYAKRTSAEPAMRMRSQAASEAPETSGSPIKAMWIAGAVAAVLLLLALIHVFSGKSSKPVAPQQAAAPASAPAATPPVSEAPAPAAQSPAAAAQVDVPAASVASASHGAGWYVIAYTYNRENQAQARASRVEHKRGGFHPIVFSPSGRGPYLVSLGGPMTENEAEAVMRRARRSGLPRDTFIRKY